jgi:hypothetical protein
MTRFRIPAVILKLKGLLSRFPLSAHVQVMPKGVVVFDGKILLARIPWDTGVSESFSFSSDYILNDLGKAKKEDLKIWKNIDGELNGNEIMLEWAAQKLNQGQPIPAEPTIPVEKVLCGEPGPRVALSYYTLCELVEIIEALTVLNPKDRERAVVVVEPIQGAPRAYFAILLDSFKGKMVDGVFSFWNPNFGAPSLKNAERWEEEKIPSASGKEG